MPVAPKRSLPKWSELEAALDAKEDAEALDLAVDAWRFSRAPVLADLVDALAANIQTEPGPNPRVLEKFQEVWLEGVGSATARTLEPFLAMLHRSPPGGMGKGWKERMAVLAQRPPDPRIARALVAVIARRPDWAIVELAVYDGDCAALLVDLADARCCAPLLAISRRRLAEWEHGPFGLWIPSLVARIEQSAMKYERLPAARAAIVAKWGDAVRARRRSSRSAVTSLFAAVDEQPEDDAPREVLADALLELGDLRGEFIALQLREARGEKLNAEARARIRSLLLAGEETWLGPGIRNALRGRVWRRGFLDEALLGSEVDSTDEWKGAVDDSQLVSLRVLDQGNASDEGYIAVLSSATSRVKVLRPRNGSVFTALRGRILPSITDIHLRQDAMRRTLDALDEAVNAFPKLRHLVLEAVPAAGAKALATMFLASKVAERVEEVTLAPRFWFTAIENPRPWLVAVGNARRFQRVTLTARSFVLRILRSGDGKELHVDCETSDGSGIEHLVGLTDVASLVVRATGTARIDAPLVAKSLKKLAARSAELPAAWKKYLSALDKLPITWT